MEFVVAIIVGLLSGVVGSILGPIVRHRLGRRQCEEQRTEEHHAEFRVKLEKRMALARSHQAYIPRLHAEVKLLNKLPGDAFSEFATEDMKEIADMGVWQPHRIDDDELRKLAERLAELDSQQLGQILALSKLSPGDVDGWLEPARRPSEELDRVMQKIDLRLDELGW